MQYCDFLLRLETAGSLFQHGVTYATFRYVWGEVVSAPLNMHGPHTMYNFTLYK